MSNMPGKARARDLETQAFPRMGRRVKDAREALKTYSIFQPSLECSPSPLRKLVANADDARHLSPSSPPHPPP
eukprot:915763-Pyramimonas_sp.AAC.1